MRTPRESRSAQSRRVVRTNMTALLAASFLLLQLLCQVFATESSGCEPPSGYVTFPEYSAAYKTHGESANWAEAQEQCAAEGAHLAVITSLDKVRNISPNVFESNYFVYIGIHRSAATRDWVRIDNGLPVTSIPWSNLNDDEKSNCAVLWRGYGGTFTDRDCNSYAAFICERSLAEGCTNPVSQQE